MVVIFLEFIGILGGCQFVVVPALFWVVSRVLLGYIRWLQGCCYGMLGGCYGCCILGIYGIFGWLPVFCSARGVLGGCKGVARVC